MYRFSFNLKKLKSFFVSSIILAYCLFASATQAGEFSGSLGAQAQYFINDALSDEQFNQNLSFVFEPEYLNQWDNNKQNIEVKLFYRQDNQDEQRRHGDIRELSWTSVFEQWELRVGISKVYWGVAETQHLVDIVNQTDAVENIDGEDKLGQPMIKASTEQDWGTVDLLVLPYFRERSFAGKHGRPRPTFIIDTSQDAIYDNDKAQNHIDFALRYSHYISDWEFGFSLFSGTGREPTGFKPIGVSAKQTLIVLPIYSLITQVGIDTQAFFNDWTWKLEATNTTLESGIDKGENSFRSVFGFEFTLVGVAESNIDLGFVVEYHYSDENISPTLLNSDLASALRFAFNDAQSTELLAGIITDLDTQSIASFAEASRRLGDSWTLALEVRAFHGAKRQQPLYAFRNDDFIQLDLNYYF